MADQLFPGLFSPLEIRGKVIKNRILSTGHDTTMPTDAAVNDALIAYHEARAKGGAGLIITQVAGVHETARYTSHILMATYDDASRLSPAGRCRCTPMALRSSASSSIRAARSWKRRTALRAGRLRAVGGLPNERFHVMPGARSGAHAARNHAGYGDAAASACMAGRSRRRARSLRATAICRRSS